MLSIRTELLEIAYQQHGPSDGPALMLLHGWPDDVRGWSAVAERLQTRGWRIIIPYLRGFGPTRFLSAATFRDARGVALAQDAIDLADALGLAMFSVAGHDWGARTAYTLAALFPERISAIVGASLAFQPRGHFNLPRFSQARKFWYQWFMSLDGGPGAVAADPKGFARIQWDTWGPPSWFEEAEFETTAASFENPDWVAITLHGYRSRWRDEPVDPRYESLQARLGQIATLSTPTLMIQGGLDSCAEPASSAGQEHHFAGPYQRLVLDGVGHFPAREVPEAVANAIDAHLRAHTGAKLGSHEIRR
jgi:pimeloyl-ACP methyl ester carboxylesterase